MTLDTTASALNTNPSIDQHPGGRHARPDAPDAPDHTERSSTNNDNAGHE